MAWRGKKSSSKLTKNQPLLYFSPFLSSLSLSLSLSSFSFSTVPSATILSTTLLPLHRLLLSLPPQRQQPINATISFSSFSSIGSNNISTDLHHHHWLDHHHLHQTCSLPMTEQPPWPSLSLLYNFFFFSLLHPIADTSHKTLHQPLVSHPNQQLLPLVSGGVPLLLSRSFSLFSWPLHA